MKISQLQVGQVVFNVMRRKMGNTTISDTCVFRILVKEIDPEGRWVRASWNCNPPEKFYERSEWRKEKPMMIESGFGSHRLATRAEIKQKKERAKIDAVQPQGVTYMGIPDCCPTHLKPYTRKPIEGGLTIKVCEQCGTDQGVSQTEGWINVIHKLGEEERNG
jgi:hypothetical protein